MQPLSDPPTGRELAQFLDPDGAAASFRLEQAGDETTAHPARKFGRGSVLFLGLLCAVLVGLVAGRAFIWWRANQVVEAAALLLIVAAVALVATWFVGRLLKWLDEFSLVHGMFARWDRTGGTIELPRLGVTLHRSRLVGAVCLTGGEWCGGQVRMGAWCPLRDGLPEGALRHGNGWIQLNELSVIAQAADGTLARYPLVTVENPWRFRELAERFAADFGLPLHVISLTGGTRRELRHEGWQHAGEFADADRPRKAAAGRVAVSDGFLFFATVTLCRPKAAGSPAAGNGREASTASPATAPKRSE